MEQSSIAPHYRYGAICSTLQIILSFGDLFLPHRQCLRRLRQLSYIDRISERTRTNKSKIFLQKNWGGEGGGGEKGHSFPLFHTLCPHQKVHKDIENIERKPCHLLICSSISNPNPFNVLNVLEVFLVQKEVPRVRKHWNRSFSAQILASRSIGRCLLLIMIGLQSCFLLC